MQLAVEIAHHSYKIYQPKYINPIYNYFLRYPSAKKKQGNEACLC